MAYKPVKQILFMITLLFTWGQTQGMQKLNFNHCFLLASHIYLADHETITIARQNLPSVKRDWLKQEDAHQDVQGFIRAQLKTTNDKRLLDGLYIKKTNDTSSMSVTNYGIEINSEKHDLLLEALRRKQTNTLRQQDRNVLGYSEVVCKHEFGHLKHKDLAHARLFHPTISLVLHGITWGIAKLCSFEKYYKSASYEDSKSTLDMIKGGAFLLTSGMIQGFIHQKLTNAYTKHLKEKRAQQYALDNTHDPEALRGYARQELIIRAKRAKKYAEAVIEELNNTITKRFYLKCYSHYIYHLFIKQHPQHVRNRYSKEALDAFRKWILQQDAIIDKLKTIFDPHHKTFNELSLEAQRAADALESFQKKQAAAQS